MAHTSVSKPAAHPENRLEVIGSLTGVHGARVDDRLEALGTVDQLTDVVDARGVTRVVLSAQDVDDLDLQGLLLRCRALAFEGLDRFRGCPTYWVQPWRSTMSRGSPCSG